MSTGVIIPGLDYPASSIVRPYPEPAALDAVQTTVGPITSAQPITIRSLALSSVRATSFADDWYNRLHIFPRSIDYGAVGSDTARQVTLWNAYFGNTTLTTIGIVNPDGITIAGPTLPRTLKPLAYVRHSAVATGDGPATIDSLLTYTTNRPDSIRVPLAGTRAHMWPFAPNWRESVTVDLSFRTDIITSRSGREQRRALRGTPRKSIGYKLTVDGTKLRIFNRAMAKWQDRPVVMGDPTRFVRLTETATTGVYSVTVTDTPMWLVDGASVVLGNQMLSVDTVVLDQVTFTSPVIDGGTVLRPTLQGMLAGSLAAQYPTSNVAEINVSFDVTPGSELPMVGDPGFDILNGREVFTRRFNWANGLDLTHDWPSEAVDFGFGRTAVFHPRAFGTITRKATFVQQGAEDMAALEMFYQRQKGQRGEFYMPSWLDDLPLKESVLAGTGNLVITGRDTFDAYDGDTVHRAVGLFFRDGRRVYRRVTGMFLDSGDTVLQCDRDFLTDIDPAELYRVSWLTASRLASDQFTQDWLSDGVAQTQLAIRTLEDLTPENPVADYDGAAQWVLEVWGERGFYGLDRLDYVVNIAYPAVWYIPEAWTFWESTQAGLRGLDYVVNVRYPGVAG